MLLIVCMHQAIDLKGRTITHYAAKGQSASVLEAVVGLDGVNGDNPSGSWLVAKVDVNDKHQRTAHVGGMDVHVGLDGMNVLHVACRWGCRCVVEAVVREAQKQGERFFSALLHSVDANGRTPLMQALRHTYGNEDVSCGAEITKVETLLRILTIEAQDEYSGMLVYFTRPANSKSNSTALTDAAFGGMKQLSFVRAEIESSAKISRVWGDDSNGQDAGELDLDFALGLRDANAKTKVSRYGVLLAEAVDGGDESVLQEVVYAIEVSEDDSKIGRRRIS